MKFEHADEVAAGSVLRTDVCVIGSGAAGIALARELDGAPHSVLMLEAGGLARNLRREEELFAIRHLGIPYSNPIPTRGRSYGGSTNLWFGRIALPDAIDFEQRSWVPGSGWPLEHAELAPWLRKAATLLDVRHFDRLLIETWPRNPAIDTFVQAGASSLGVFLWATAPFMGTHHRQTLEASANVRTLLDATAVGLVANEGSTAIEGLDVCGRFGNRFTVRASTYVLAAGGLENARLLLASTRRSPAGVANGRDLVGRFYMDHPRSEGLARVDLKGLSVAQLERLSLLGEKAKSDYGKVQLRLTFDPELQRREGLLNHSLHAHFVSEMHELSGYLLAKRLLGRLRRTLPDDATSLGDDLLGFVAEAPSLVRSTLKSKLLGARPTALLVVDQMEQEPDQDSRITLDWTNRNRWGLPELRLDWRVGASTYRSQRRMHELFDATLKRHGLGRLESRLLESPDHVPTLREMKHPSGTTKMSDSPSTGVVDAQLRAHELDNLYILGSSTFPTAGHFNPTLLIVGLAARLAARLRQRAPFAR